MAPISALSLPTVRMSEADCNVVRDALNGSLGVYQTAITSFILLLMIFFYPWICIRGVHTSVNRLVFADDGEARISTRTRRASDAGLVLLLPALPALAVFSYFYTRRNVSREALRGVDVVDEESLAHALDVCKMILRENLQQSVESAKLFAHDFKWRTALTHWEMILFGLVYGFIILCFAVWFVRKCLWYFGDPDRERWNAAAANAAVAQTSEAAFARSVSGQPNPLREVTGRYDLPVFELDCVGEDNCAICVDDLTYHSVTQLPCEHRFHYNCMSTWLVKAGEFRCPLCNAVFDNASANMQLPP